MEIAAQSETMTVQVSVPLIDSSSSSNRQVIDSRTIESIPLHGRNYLDLILLTPGVAVNDTVPFALAPARDTRGRDPRRASRQHRVFDRRSREQRRFSGRRLPELHPGCHSGVRGHRRRIQAEFGRGAGGVINVLTKSGTDEIRATAFLFLRDDAMDPSTVKGADAPRLKRHNAGVTLGGPVIRERAWYFGSFELFEESGSRFFLPISWPALPRTRIFHATRRSSVLQIHVIAEPQKRRDQRHLLLGVGSVNRLRRRRHSPSPATRYEEE
jgi:hypothetical protein